MTGIGKLVAAGLAVVALGAIGNFVSAQHRHGPGMMGMGHGSATSAEMGEIHDMFTHHDRIKRTVTNLPDGIRTVTESDDPEMTKVLVSHVIGMGKRVEEGRDPHLPIQSATLEVIFRNRDRIRSSYETTAKGIAVVQTSTDPETVAALQKHAAEVTGLVERGMAAAHESMMRRFGGSMGDHHMDRATGPERSR